MGEFTAHHVTLSVRNLSYSVDFYSSLGFQVLMCWESASRNLSIAHLGHSNGSLILELFCYAENSSESALSLDIGNDLASVGVKHFALQVSGLESVHDRAVVKWGGASVTDITAGRTGIRYFFLRDPDGMWVEIVEDHRELDPASPLVVRGGP
jgi:glyoxylase I family protein